MEVLPDFDLIRPLSLAEAVKARRAHPTARPLGGGTDLLVNLRRGIGEPPSALIDLNDVAEMQTIRVTAETIEIGASVTIRDIAEHAGVGEHFPAIAAAAASIAGPTHRVMGTLGGNLCLDTRCIYYNQSEWWREANDFCLKFKGVTCHVAPKSAVCFATFSGDLAPALLVHDAEVDIAGPDGSRTIPLDDLYTGDGQRYLALRPGELVVRARASKVFGLRASYDKMRVRRSIDYPLAGVAVALLRDGDRLETLRVAVTGANPRPVLLKGTLDLCGGPLTGELFARLDALMSDQIMAMKTTFTPGHYRRKVALGLAERLIRALFAAN